MKKNLEFNPIVKDPHAQALICKFLDFQKDTPSVTHYFELSDRDIIAYEVSEPQDKKILWTIITVHGLCGSHKSAYNRRLAKRFVQKGYRVIRINLKGCGTGKGLSKGIYNSGCANQILELLVHFKKQYLKSFFIQIGFSLGANVTLKMLGDYNTVTNEILTGAITISPPCDLFASNRRFALPENAFISKYFLRLLLDDVYDIHRNYPDLGDPGFPDGMNLYDFDEYYVAPRSNYKGAMDYYACCSSMHVVENIKTPTFIQFAMDDPIIKHDSLDDKDLMNNVRIIKTKYGSHIGYVGFNLFKDLRWLDQRICEWVDELILMSGVL